MSNSKAIQESIRALYKDGADLVAAFQRNKEEHFQYKYQDWYSKALRVIKTLAPERHEEFRRYYEIDPKRKSLGYGTYVIQDYIKNVVPNKFQHPDFNAHDQTVLCFFNQLTILKAVAEHAASVLADIQGTLFAEVEDNEIAAARKLMKVSLRAAGALVGVVIEAHLQKVASSRGIIVSKKNPTIADLNEPLKAASVIDLSSWRKITYLADLRNICAHKKDAEPTPDQVKELIEGAEWLVKSVN